MTTNKERREVARRLREMSGWGGEVDCAEWGERVLNLLYRGGEDCTDGEYYARLADLIEPSEPKVKRVAEVKVDGEQLEKLAHDAAVELTGIDRDALLALAEEMEEFGNLPVKHPGIRVLHNDDFSRELGYARRIREAVGA